MPEHLHTIADTVTSKLTDRGQLDALAGDLRATKRKINPYVEIAS